METNRGVTWQNIVIVEEQFLIEGKRYQFKKCDLFTPENYEQRFGWLLAQHYGWINLQAAGIFQDTLLVMIETPKETNNEIGNNVAINLSGPYLHTQESPWEISDLVKIID